MFQGQVGSCSVSAAVIYYCWKLWVRKYWIECEVNRNRELSVESNMPSKRKWELKTHMSGQMTKCSYY